ncbi:O-antigen ligase family protein [Aurantiacibacter sediminis]|uniref:O-antigen ligase family protein n=1 Tax=Aurantiacibacter sediminis TaxID=2793064 RepID=A0ABS0N2L3_9SPHN|nr:O-antigen ligase family protein [Aurantiacibacter sediminis]MBH5321254.1 O-antigen ligase family protein [Aurantiacibacter sediminis]
MSTGVPSLPRRFRSAAPAKRRVLQSAGLPKHLYFLIIAGYACLLPREFTVSIAGANLPPYRLMLVFSLPFIVQSFQSGGVKVRPFDAVVVLAALWFPIALANTATMRDVFIVGGSQGIDYPLSYLLGRASIRHYRDVGRFFRALIPGLAVIALILAAEAVSGQMILRPLAAQITGQAPPILYEQERFGLLRATGPFPHPILAGLFMATILPFAWYVLRRPAYRAIGLVIAFCAVFTVSSAAVIAGAISGAAIILNWLKRETRLPVWPLALFGASVIALFIELASGNGLLNFLLRNFTLDSGSAFYRRLIWEYAGAEALAHPFFGIGLRDWERLPWMVESIDSYWLLLATRYGMPLPALIMVLMVGAIVITLRQSRGRPRYERDIAAAFAIAIASMIVAGFTVFIWENMTCWLLLLCGMAVSLGMEQKPQKRRVRRPTPRPAFSSPTVDGAS